MNLIIESTMDILNSTGGIALIGKIFQDIGLNFESHTVLKSAEKSILRILAGLMTQGRSSFAEASLLANALQKVHLPFLSQLCSTRSNQIFPASELNTRAMEWGPSACLEQ